MLLDEFVWNIGGSCVWQKAWLQKTTNTLRTEIKKSASVFLIKKHQNDIEVVPEYEKVFDNRDILRF